MGSILTGLFLKGKLSIWPGPQARVGTPGHAITSFSIRVFYSELGLCPKWQPVSIDHLGLTAGTGAPTENEERG
jgi:hypothetical protein